MPRRRRGAKIVTSADEEVLDENPLEEEGPEKEPEEEEEEEELEEEPTSPNAKRKISDLKDLIFLGRLEEEVDFSGFKFKIITLSTGQQRKLVENLMLLSEAERFARVRDYTMAQVIESVNNVPLEKLCTDESIEDEHLQRLSVISGWQSTLVDFLYKSYEDLFSRSNEGFGEDDLKK